MILHTPRFILKQNPKTCSIATIQNSHISKFPQHPNPKFKTSITLSQNHQKPNNNKAFEEKKLAFVDYDKGTHKVTVRINGFHKSDLPKHQRLRVESDSFQKDWGIIEVVDKIMKLAGRFARKNFHIIIKSP
ncbi:hypothetical protein K7X08_001537 [Anisodus acutangulus]|uniref:Uncharacterized protein n=1 Tax=Anisodus acutangulus TaxID=402998 RepID=A0A9Q1MNW7_9SOLA|nr:hypothetical protein K7X08_001537 [Anisodus acutangulus]